MKSNPFKLIAPPTNVARQFEVMCEWVDHMAHVLEHRDDCLMCQVHGYIACDAARALINAGPPSILQETLAVSSPT